MLVARNIWPERCVDRSDVSKNVRLKSIFVSVRKIAELNKDTWNEIYRLLDLVHNNGIEQAVKLSKRFREDPPCSISIMPDFCSSS